MALTRVLLPALALLLPAALHAESPEVVVELADGTLLPGTLAGDVELVLVAGDAETKIGVRAVQRLTPSAVSETDAAALAAEVAKLEAAWRADEYATRENASLEARKLPGAAAPAVARLTADADPEVASRAREALWALQARGDLRDPRDRVETDGRIARGRLRPWKATLTTALGTVEIASQDVRTWRRAALPEEEPAGVADKPETWPPPPADRPPGDPPEGRLRAVMFLRGGVRLVGHLAPDALTLRDSAGAAVAAAGVLSLVREKESGPFRASRAGKGALEVTLGAKSVEMQAAGRGWTVPEGLIEAIEFGPLRRGGGSLARLVAEFQRAAEAGQDPPATKFWVHIRDQNANPWDSAGKLGMTWSLLKVQGEACLVGSHSGTNAYTGDTPIQQELSILAIRRRDLPPPEGLDVSDSYSGWSGGEVRLTRPVAGTSLTSLEAANKLVEEEFGKDWRMAEFHDTSTLGWHWWGYWVDQPEKK